MFRVPSSTPPSTPDSRRSSRHAPSTTPAGPPPDRSFIPSSTPAGPPPASNSLFGNSRPNFAQPGSFAFNASTYGSSPPKNGILEGVGSGSIRTSTIGRPGSQRGRTASSGFRMPSSPPRISDEDEEDDEGSEEDEDEDMDDEEEDEDAEGEEDEDMDEESEEEPAVTQRRAKTSDRLSQSVASRTSAGETPTGPTIVRPGAKQSQYSLLALAKGLTPNLDGAPLREPDETILETERLLEKLSESYANDAPEQRPRLLENIAHELLSLWQTSSETRGGFASGHPGAAAAISNATKLSSLLLNIHHPSPLLNHRQSTASSFALTRQGHDNLASIPKVLLDWLNHCRSIDSEIDVVLKQSRGYSKHQHYWDAVHAAATRGHFSVTLQLLKGANWEVAETAQEDLEESGYSGHHLAYAREAANAAINLLLECPAVVSDDWDIKGHDWNIFRKRIHHVRHDLEELAEGDSRNRHSVSQPFSASHFGISQSQASFHLSVASRRAESKVPWSIYQNLSKLYELLLGNEEEILTIASDWIEATLCLAIWWDGDEEEVAPGSLAASRRNLARSQRIRTVDLTPVKAYCQRMSSAFAAVLESEDEFSINTSDRFEVGVACIVDDNVEGALQIIRSASLMVASAVAEIATAGEWFATPDRILNQFDQSDLMVLSYTEQQRTGMSQNDLLAAYADLLTSRGQVTSQDGKTVREGWELAIQVLGRMDDTILANARIERILDQLPLQSADQVDKITRLCHNMGLSKQAMGISLKFADHLRANTQNYGDTLLYYARAHAAPKIQEVLRTLVAHCLVKSIAYPPPAELDDSLNALITTPKQTLTKLASLDSEGAQLLSNHLSGYATIRKFYDLRDQEVLLKNGEKSAQKPMARKRAAANALMVIITSAASSIRGGLYDPDVETVVQVDVLLPLLGEVLVFVNQSKRTLTLRHLYSLLAAVEDLSTAPSMIRNQCEEALHTTLAAAHDSFSPSNSGRSLQKSTSNLTTASSQYSLINSTEFSSVEGHSTESSAVLVRGGSVDDAKRGWDWRKGFPKGAKGDDVVRVLRLGIARELARAFAEGEVTPQ